MSRVLVKPNFYVPEGYDGPTEAILPDSVVEFTANRLGLPGNGLRVIDPACGVGTIPRVLRGLGVELVDGGDIDPKRYETARYIADRLNSRGIGQGTVVNTDMAELPRRYGYDAMYVSLPFDLFPEGMPGPDLASSLASQLRNRGMLIVDSAEMATRNGQQIPVAERQIRYFEKYGFTLADKVTYETETPRPGFDSEFTELAFILGEYRGVGLTSIIRAWRGNRIKTYPCDMDDFRPGARAELARIAREFGEPGVHDGQHATRRENVLGGPVRPLFKSVPSDVLCREAPWIIDYYMGPWLKAARRFLGPEAVPSENPDNFPFLYITNGPYERHVGTNRPVGPELIEGECSPDNVRAPIPEALFRDCTRGYPKKLGELAIVDLNGITHGVEPLKVGKRTMLVGDFWTPDSPEGVRPPLPRLGRGFKRYS